MKNTAQDWNLWDLNGVLGKESNGGNIQFYSIFSKVMVKKTKNLTNPAGSTVHVNALVHKESSKIW
jgi:hypothetical protein